jgi:hypothetical protein
VDTYQLTQQLAAAGDVALTTSSIEVVFNEPVVHDSAEAAFEIEPWVAGGFSWSGATMIFTPSWIDESFNLRISLAFLKAISTVANGASLPPGLESFPSGATQISVASKEKPENKIKISVAKTILWYFNIFLTLDMDINKI